MRLLTLAAAAAILASHAFAQTPTTGTTAPAAAPPPVTAVAPRFTRRPVTTPAPTVPPPAATATPGTEQVAPVIAPRRPGRKLQERFDEANTTHDGHLTLEQARTKMPSVARDFAIIDKDRLGYVTEEQIREHRKEERAATRAKNVAAKAAAAAKPK